MADNNTTSVKVVSAKLEVENVAGDEVLILRGVVDSGSLDRLKISDYQREQLSGPKIDGIMEGIRSHSVPDIVLGMRGEHIVERGDIFHLQDDVYIIDGYQRQTAALRLLDLPNDVVPALGCKVHLNSSYTFEKALFSKLNLGQTKLSPNITLRNLADGNPAIGALFKLTKDPGFRLHNQVGWNQNKRKADLISAVTYIQAAAMLHSHAGPGRSNSAVELARGLEKIMETVNKRNLVENVRRFYQLIDQCWGLGQITYRDRVAYVKASFLVALANVLSDHTAFWNGDLLEISVANQNRLARFNVNDPEVMRLSSGGGGLATKSLAFLMIDHMDHGKRSGRLVRRRPLRDRPSFDLVQDGEVDE